MARLTPSAVIDALREVDDPELGRSLVDLDMIRNVEVTPEGAVSFTVVLTTPACPLKSKIESDCRAAVEALDGVASVEVKLDAKVQGVPASQEDPLSEVEQIILVMSGKGGVGKSTISANLALALASTGARVGLMDADVQGPSIPMILGSDKPAMASPEGRIVPAVEYGIKFLSMAQFLEKDSQAVVWRGPMMSTLLRQFLQDVDWGKLDYLVIDLPPGTGDAALTLTQTVKLTGAVIVTTPQDVALLDVKKAVDMCREVCVPVLGVVENMSVFICPDCGARHELFGAGGGQAIAELAGAPLLGKIALDPQIRERGDRGSPPIVSDPDAEHTRTFIETAQALASHIAKNGLGRTAGGEPPSGNGAPGCGHGH